MHLAPIFTISDYEATGAHLSYDSTPRVEPLLDAFICMNHTSITITSGTPGQVDSPHYKSNIVL